MYAIVEFPETKETEIVPVKWIIGNFSYWPPFKTAERVRRSVDNNDDYDERWDRFPIRILRRYGSYAEARINLARAEYTSHLDTESEGGRGKRKRVSKRLSSSSSESDVPKTPVQKKRKSTANAKKTIPSPPEIIAPIRRISSSSDKEHRSEQEIQAVTGSNDQLEMTPPHHTSNLESPIAVVHSENDSPHRQIQPSVTPVNGRPVQPSNEAAPVTNNSRNNGDPENLPGPSKNNCRNLRVNEFHGEINSNLGLLILKKLAKIDRVQNTEIIPLLHALAEREGGEINPENAPASALQDIPLPLTSFEELETVENFIGQTSNNRLLVNHLLTRVGRSRDFSKITRKIMRFIMTSEFAKNFNWAGRPPKRGFSLLLLKEVVIDVVSQASNGNIDRAVIEAIIKDWLKQAKNRCRRPA